MFHELRKDLTALLLRNFSQTVYVAKEMNQKQHIVPQVYLKQFGYQDKHGRWKVPAVSVKDIELMNRLDKDIIKQSNIKSLLREVNYYDIPDFESNGLLEEFFQLPEDRYANVIHEIEQKGELPLKKKDMLFGFIAHLAVRTKKYTNMLEQILEDRDYSYLLGVLEGNHRRVDHLYAVQRKSALNLLTGLSGGYIYLRLQQDFRISIVATISDEKWATTDNPVLIKCGVNQHGIIDFMGIDTKLICPLSKDYLAYIDHPKSNINFYEGFDQLAENKVNSISTSAFEKVWMDVTDGSRITEYLILPTKIPESEK